MKIFILILILSLFILTSCKDEPTAPEAEDNIELTQKHIVDLQSNSSDLFSSLLSQMDTVSAKDSILKVFLKDTSGQSGMVTEQGIVVKYKSGILGGLLIDPQDYPEMDSVEYSLPFNKITPNNFYKLGVNKSKATILLNPHYFERQKYTNKIIDYYNVVFPQVGYKQPEIFLNDEVTLDRLTQLSNYGIVHLYSHGMHFELSDEVYFLTCETVNLSTTTKYWDLINEGEIPLICQFNGKTKYYVSPKFFSTYNNFTNDSTIVYGGFCFSFLGNWGTEMINAGAIAYFGFDWSVWTSYNAWWAQSLFYSMSDISKTAPVSIEDWYFDTTAKRYWDEKNNRDVCLPLIRAKISVIYYI